MICHLLDARWSWVLIVLCATSLVGALGQSADTAAHDTQLAYSYDLHRDGAPRAEDVEGRSPLPDDLRSERLGSRVLEAASQADVPLAPNTTRNFGSHGSEFLDDAIRSPVVRPDLANLSSKIQRQMGTRGWTPDLIDEAVLQGRGYPAINKLGGANTPATRYVHPGTGQSVVIDNATGQVIQVGGPGFRY